MFRVAAASMASATTMHIANCMPEFAEVETTQQVGNMTQLTGFGPTMPSLRNSFTQRGIAIATMDSEEPHKVDATSLGLTTLQMCREMRSAIIPNDVVVSEAEANQCLEVTGPHSGLLPEELAIVARLRKVLGYKSSCS